MAKYYILIAGLTLGLTQAASAQAARPSCGASHYKIFALPLHPSRINNSGLIVGSTEDHGLATWSEKDGLREINLPDGFTSAEPAGITADGTVVGSARRKDSSQPVAFRYSDGKFALLSESNSKASAANDDGEVTGESAGHLVLWRKNASTPLGDCCGGAIHAINNRGQIVGQLNDKEGRYNAFLWDVSHGLQPVSTPRAMNSEALAINDLGHVLVQSFTPNAVYLERDGELIPVQLSPEFASQPLALSDCDTIVGEFGAASDFNHAFFWDEKHGFRDLSGLADVGTDWILESAIDINNRGEIIGVGDHAGDEDAGFLLVPEEQGLRPSTVPKK